MENLGQGELDRTARVEFTNGYGVMGMRHCKWSRWNPDNAHYHTTGVATNQPPVRASTRTVG